MKAKHRHRVKTCATVGWNHCVAATRGEKACDGMAHGGVVFIEHCACGAERQTESNGRHENKGAWSGGKYADQDD
jgi:hypothetical protein